jgi:hypothetical protein
MGGAGITILRTIRLMGKRRPTYHLELLELESRALLSAASLASQQPHVLNGTVHGTYSTGQAGKQTSRPTLISGTGKVQDLGRVRVTGSVQAAGVADAGGGMGLLTLANAKGRLVLRLDASVQGSGASSSSSSRYAYVVQRGTGTFRHWTGGGSLALDLGPPSSSGASQTGGTSVAGTFAIVIEPTPAPVVPGTGSSSGEPTPPGTTPPVPIDPGGGGGDGGGGGGGTTQPPPPVPMPSITSGIRGMAVEGPIAPVSRPGEPDTRVLPGAIITVQPAGGGPELARQQVDAMGNFQIELAPGTYEIVPLPPQPGSLFPRGIAQEITVGANQVVDLVVNYDTGIR